MSKPRFGREIFTDGMDRVIFNGPAIIYFLKDPMREKPFKGVAKCNVRDEYDTTYGMELARAKAQLKRDRYFLRKLLKLKA